MKQTFYQLHVIRSVKCKYGNKKIIKMEVDHPAGRWRRPRPRPSCCPEL